MSHKDIDVLILISHFFIGNLLYKILDFYSDNLVRRPCIKFNKFLLVYITIAYPPSLPLDDHGPDMFDLDGIDHCLDPDCTVLHGTSYVPVPRS